MSRHISWPLRWGWALLTLQVVSACGGGSGGGGDGGTPSPGRDTTAPTTRATPQGGGFDGGVTVTLTCDDGAGSGCAATHYTLDGSTPTASSPSYSEVLTLNESATLKFFSVDKAGNAEAVKQEQYTVTSGGRDTVAPTTVASPAGGTYNGPRGVALQCADEASGCAATYYTQDGSEPTAQSPRYSAPLNVTASTTLRFFSVDTAGNAEVVRTEHYVLDTQAPTVTASPRSGVHRTAFTLTLTCDDGTGSGCAAIHFTTDGTQPTVASPRYTQPLPVEDFVTVRFVALDAAGNLSPVVSETYAFDLTGPSTTPNQRGGTFAAPVTVTLLCEDNLNDGCEGTYYTLDGTTPTRASTRYAQPLSITSTTTLTFFSVDAVGNEGPVTAEQYVIDTAPPTVTATPRGGPFKTLPTVTLTCDDGPVASGCIDIHYTTDDTPPDIHSPRYTGPIALLSTTVLRFIGVDALGHVSAEVSETYRVDTSAPWTSVHPPGILTRNVQNVVFNCVDDEACGATYYTLDGSTPTTSSPKYTQAIRIADTTTLKFFSVDQAGNAEAVQTEVYTFDRVPPTTTASPAGGTYASPLAVTLSCDDGTGSGCYNTLYTTDGSDPTKSLTASLYTEPIYIQGNTQLRFTSHDRLGNEERPVSQLYQPSITPAQVSADIAAVRAAPLGTELSLPIRGARVTYVKPLIGNPISDPAGFFLQAETAGPAIFVAVDPTTLTPPLAVGDLVKLTVTRMGGANGIPYVMSIADVLILSRNNSLWQLVQGVSYVDLPAVVGDYESELVNVRGTLNGEFIPAGEGFVQAPMTTEGTPWDSPSAAFLRLRLPADLPDQLLLEKGCSFMIESPLWAFTNGNEVTFAQPSIWAASDVLSSSCPAPWLTSARATSLTSLTVFFDQHIDPASVVASGSQFTLSGGLSVTAATGVGREVRLTTSPQVAGVTYTVTVADSVHDRRGQSVNSVANSASFLGYVPPAKLRLTELAPNLLNGGDLIELSVLEGGNTDGMSLVDGSTTVATFPTALVATGDLLVVHLSPGANPGADVYVSETTGQGQYPHASYASNYDTAWDFVGEATNLVYPGNHVFLVKDPSGETQDALAVTSPGNSYPLFVTWLQAAQADGQWLPVDCQGAPCTYASAPSAWDVSVSWGQSLPEDRSVTLGRVQPEDANTLAEWAVGPGTLGVLNP